jgi:hypothetical protein
MAQASSDTGMRCRRWDWSRATWFKNCERASPALSRNLATHYFPYKSGKIIGNDGDFRFWHSADATGHADDVRS